ncbi:unnamed protein product, partial [Rotaria magnacalcarata]
MMGRALGERTV